MKTKLKFGIYNSVKDTAKAINDLIYGTPNRKLVQITPVSNFVLGSSSTEYVVWYDEKASDE